MSARIALLAIGALSFGLGVVAHAQTVRQRTPTQVREVTPRIEAPESGVMRSPERDVRFSYDPAKVAENIRMLEQRIRELEAHVHRYQDRALGASRSVSVAAIRGDDERWNDYEVWVVAPGLETMGGATKTLRTEGPTR